jgi:hypothetical protein
MEKDAILEIIPTENDWLRSPEVSIKVFDHLLKHSRAVDISPHLAKLSESLFYYL